MSDPVTLSIVMPCYNEEDLIEATVREVQLCGLDRIPGSELVIVDDGSKDQTGAILDRLSAEDGRLRVIHQANQGHGGAVVAGLNQARGAVLCQLDSDAQISLHQLEAHYLSVTEESPLFGIRVARKDPVHRLVLSRFIELVTWCLFGVFIRDGNIPYKIFASRLWEEGKQVLPQGVLAPSIFLAIFWTLRGYRIQRVPIEHRARAGGQTVLGLLRLFRFCNLAFRQLLEFRSRVRCLQK